MFATSLESGIESAGERHKNQAQAKNAREQVLRKALNSGSSKGLYRDPAAGTAGKSVSGGDVLNAPRETSGFKRRR